MLHGRSFTNIPWDGDSEWPVTEKKPAQFFASYVSRDHMRTASLLIVRQSIETLEALQNEAYDTDLMKHIQICGIVTLVSYCTHEK